jgi:hypothetical protein
MLIHALVYILTLKEVVECRKNMELTAMAILAARVEVALN